MTSDDDDETATEQPSQMRGSAEQARPSMEARPPRPRTPIPPDTILIGKKPLMSYATAVMMHFNMGSKELTVKARGRAISHAVDVVEIVRRRFFSGRIAIKEVKIGTEVLGEEGETRNVSSIEIKVSRTE